MQRIIAFFVGAYWMAFFSLLALAAMAEATGEVYAIFQALSLPGSSGALDVEAGPFLSTALAIGFSLAAALFLWMLGTALVHRNREVGDTDDVARVAFGVATGMMAVLLAVGVWYPVHGLFASSSMQLAALLVSYIAVYAKQRRGTHAPQEQPDDVTATARFMALGAAHSSMLTRISGRPGSQDEGF